MATGIDSTDYVMKVYDTLALAEAGLDSTALHVTSSSDPTIKTYRQTSADHYFTFQRYYYRIESPEPVKGMFIDWDDGEDNSPEKANSEWKMFDTPRTYGIFEHVYTKHSTFYPLIRLISVGDFKSKYYTPNGGDHAALDSTSISAGQNGSSMVSKDSSSNPRIPILKPSNMPPTGVLKLSKSRIYSGIDNDNMTASKYIYAYYDGALTSFSDVIVTYEDDQGSIAEATITPIKTSGNLTSGGGAPSYTGAVYAKRLLKAQVETMTEGAGGLNTSDRVYIKIGATSANVTTDKTLSILSLGSSIQKEGGAMYSLLADGSESRTKCSNRTIENYYFDDDKLNVGGAIQAQTIIDEDTSKEGEVSDTLVAGLSNSTVGQKTFSYTFSNEVNYTKDSYGRFYDEQRLIRLQVEDDHTPAAGDRMSKSFIESFTVGDSAAYGPYSAVPADGHTRKQPTSLNHEALLMYTKENGAGTGTNWVDLTAKNIVDNGNIIDLTGSGNFTLTTTSTIDAHPENFLLMVKTDKFDRIHVRVNNLLGFDEEGEVRLVAWYTGVESQAGSTMTGNTIWKPLRIVDGTTTGADKTSLYRSGTISFERPPDWTSVQADTMYGGSDGGGDTWLLSNESPVLSVNSSAGPLTNWNFNGYGIMFGICARTGVADVKLQVANVWPYNNSHSQPVKIIDPHHVSLNSMGIAQSISFGRNTKVRKVESRLGVTDIQKIGAAGGSVSFGGVDLSGTDRKLAKEYQQKAVPVYLDVDHKNSEKTRFFGVITKMTEDHPLGDMTRKWSVTLEVSYIIELNSDGTILSDGKIALGGKINNESEYVL